MSAATMKKLLGLWFSLICSAVPDLLANECGEEVFVVAITQAELEEFAELNCVGPVNVTLGDREGLQESDISDLSPLGSLKEIKLAIYNIGTLEDLSGLENVEQLPGLERMRKGYRPPPHTHRSHSIEAGGNETLRG